MEKNLTEKKFEPTLDEPKSDLAVGHQKVFDKTMRKSQIQLEEVDKMLNEKEQSLKKKIFNLAKMESLVHADPKLSAIYNEMSENGEEKYGYHYNETIMNMIFNDYVLNSSKYLQKYKMAIPKEKKRRDKSGINQLKKSAQKKQDATGTKIVDPELNESSLSFGSAAYETPVGFKDDVDNVSKEIDTDAEKEELMEIKVVLPGHEVRAYGEHSPAGTNVSSAIANPTPNTEVKKPFYKGGKIVSPVLKEGEEKVDEGLSLFKEEEKMAQNPSNLEAIKTEAQRISKEEGVVQHVNKKSDDNYVVSDWFDSDNTIVSYENGMLKENEEIDETTGAASSGAYVGPAVWGSGDLMKGGKKQKKDKKSFWDGGVMVQESKNYLTEPDGFEKYFNRLNEEMIREEMITDLKMLGRKVTKEDIPNLAGQALYDVAIALANRYLPLSWNDLADTNSMWDYIDENGGMSFEDLKVGVKEACDERLAEEGFPEDLMEHHATTREEKIDTILQILNSQDDGTIVGAEAFENMSDIALDQTYRDVEAMAGIAEQQLNEKAKSKKQQRFMGMVHAFQKGDLKPSEVGDKVEKAAASMTDKEAEDFATTKHKGLPEKVTENPALMALGTAAASGAGQAIGNRVADKIGLEENDNPIVQYDSDRAGEEPFELGGIKWQFVNAIYPDGKKDIGVYRFGHDLVYDYEWFKNNVQVNENSMTMIDQQEDSMAMKPPVNTSQGGVDTGMNTAMGGLNEELKQLNKEMALYEMHQKKLKEMSEEKKHGAMVLKDRLGKENEKNFKSDLKHSGTKEIIDTTKELEWKDQQTDVPSDPQKLGKDIEKTELKNTKGEAFKDEGNSANNEGDEIPKRNLTDDETDEVDLYRKGLGDFVFDNKPDERFEERMERDMGEKNYKMRKKRMEFNADAPMYNKDSQPVDDGIEKVQFDKAKTEWNERMGIKESAMSGKYVDELGVTRFFDFNINEVWEMNEGAVPYLTELNLDGLGNTYNSKVQVNEGIANVLATHKFYTNGTEVFALKNPVQNLTESEHKEETRPVNEQFNKMKHLLGYNPKDFSNTKNIKL